MYARAWDLRAHASALGSAAGNVQMPDAVDQLFDRADADLLRPASGHSYTLPEPNERHTWHGHLSNGEMRPSTPGEDALALNLAAARQELDIIKER